MSSSLISLVLVGKKATANFVTITWRVPIGRRSSHQLLPYKMAQDEKKPRSRHCSVLLPLTGQRHHVSLWLGKCGVAHIPRGHHSFDSSCSNKQTFFSPQDESRTGPAAFLRGHLPCRTRQRLVRKCVSRSVLGQGCLVSGHASLCSQTDDQASWLAISPSMLASTPWRVSTGLVTQDRARQATCPSGRTSTAPSCSTP